jgi:hypothetical protein
MSNSLSNSLLAQLFAQQSGDPFLVLVTISHSSFNTIRLVNNTENIVSRGNTYQAFPVRVRLPVDDGESARVVQLELDNVSRELVDEIRSVTTEITVKLEMILASMPDQVQMILDELLITNLTYSKTRITASLIFDNFLNTEMTSEKYGPTNFPGIF